MLLRFFLSIFFFLFALLLALLQYIVAQYETAVPINLLLVSVLFVSIIFRYTWALLLAVLSAFFIDQFAFPFGDTSIPLFAGLLVTNFLFIRFFTNRSLWTLLLLGNIATIIAYGAHTLLVRPWHFFILELGSQLILHSILFVLLFAITNMLTNRLKPYILFSK